MQHHRPMASTQRRRAVCLALACLLCFAAVACSGASAPPPCPGGAARVLGFDGGAWCRVATGCDDASASGHDSLASAYARGPAVAVILAVRTRHSARNITSQLDAAIAQRHAHPALPWLSHAEVARFFAHDSAVASDAVRTWLVSRGFLAPDIRHAEIGALVHASAPACAVESAFGGAGGVTVAAYVRAEDDAAAAIAAGRVAFAAEPRVGSAARTPAQRLGVPPALREHVEGVYIQRGKTALRLHDASPGGMPNRQHERRKLRADVTGSCGFDVCGDDDTNGGALMCPSRLRSQYGFNATASQGTSSRVGVLEFSAYVDPYELQLFAYCAGLPQTPSMTAASGIPGAGGDDPGSLPDEPSAQACMQGSAGFSAGCSEAALDVQTVASASLGSVPIDVFVCKNGVSYAYCITDMLALDPLPSVFSVSWSQDEADFFPAAHDEQGFWLDKGDAVFAAAGARGVSVFAASGDLGASGRDHGCGFTVQWPASSPHVTAVGATAFVDGDPSGPERCGMGPQDGFTSGGGFSAHFDAPSWQTTSVQSSLDAIASAGRAQGLPTDQASAQHVPAAGFYAGGRAVPDVALSGASYPIVGVDKPDDRSYRATSSGTSAATPAWAGFVAVVNDARAARGKQPLGGRLNTLLYELYASEGAGLFTDITRGDNKCRKSREQSDCCAHGFEARTGFDATTGLGTPVWVHLWEELVGAP